VQNCGIIQDLNSTKIFARSFLELMFEFCPFFGVDLMFVNSKKKVVGWFFLVRNNKKRVWLVGFS